MPHGEIISQQYNPLKPIELKEIDGVKWPPIEVGFEDLHIYPILETRFALFFVNKTLRFVVPYNIEDNHYVDEMLTKNTVPTYYGQHGTWKSIEPHMGMISYAAEYDEFYPNDHADPQPVWEVNSIAGYLYDNHNQIILNNVHIPIFSTDFSTITGMTKEDVDQLRPLYLEDWLKREGIPFENNIGYISKQRTTSSICIGLNFIVYYKPEFEEAFSFLREHGIRLEKYVQSSHECKGFEAWRIPYSIHTKSFSPEDIEKAFPIHVLIPSRKRLKTIRYLGKTQPKKPAEPSKPKLTEDAVQRHARHCPECKFEVISEGGHNVRLTHYEGDCPTFEVPKFVILDDNGSDTFTVVEIGTSSFQGNQQITTVILPSSITIVDEKAFFGCVNLTSAYLSNGITDINDHAFDGCSLSNGIIIPSTVSHIGHSVFSGECEISALCSPNVLSADSVLGDCTIHFFKQDGGNESSVTVPVKGLLPFVRSLDYDQYFYLKALLEGRDYCDKSVELNDAINKKFQQYMDEDLIEGNIIVNYYTEILSKMM